MRFPIYFFLLSSLFSLNESFAAPPAPAPASGPAPYTAYPSRYNVQRRPSSLAPSGVQVTEDSWWTPETGHFEIGYETPATGDAPSLLGQNVVSFGMWVDPIVGFDVFFSYAKGSDPSSQGTNTVANPATNTSTATTTYTPGNNPAFSLFSIGAGLKLRAIQTNWFQFHYGLVVGLMPGSSTTYQTGTHVVTTPDTTAPTNYNIADTNVGTVTTQLGTQFVVGPRVGTEFYLKWIPHLALGFSSGIVTSFGGSTTVTTATTSQTTAVTGGTPATPNVTSNVSNVVTSNATRRGTTFGIGGTTFNLFGTFTVRYLW